MARINGYATARLRQWLHLAGCVESVAPLLKLSTKSCGLSKLSALNRWRINELSALNRWRLCVESVAHLIKSLYSPVINTPVVGASPNVHNPVGLHTNRLALATNSLLKS